MRLWSILSALHLSVLLAWSVNVWLAGPPHGDWFTFRLAAERAFGGELDAVWATDFDLVREDRWFYPPYSLWLYWPLRGMSDRAAYLVCAGGQLAAAGASFVLLVRTLAIPRALALTAGLVFAASAANQYNLMLGQNGATFLLGYTLSVVLLRRGQPFLAGLALAPLGIKPNFTTPPAVAFLVRDRRALLGFGLAGLFLLATSAPFGQHAWQDFAVAAANQAAYAGSDLGGRHNLTVRGLVLACTGSPLGASLGWGLSLLLGGWALVRIASTAADPVRRLSAAVLVTLAANPYVNAYDGVLFLIPALDELADRHPDGPDRGLWLALALAWIVDARNWLWPLLTGLSPGNFSLVGAVALVWLIRWGTRAAAGPAPDGRA